MHQSILIGSVATKEGLFVLSAQSYDAARPAAFLIKPSRALKLWHLKRGEDTAHSVPLPARFEMNPFTFADVTTSGVYIVEQHQTDVVPNVHGKGKCCKIPSKRVLTRVPLNGTAAEIVATGLSDVKVGDNIVCWNNRHVYPYTQYDMVCHTPGLPFIKFASDTHSFLGDLVATRFGTWWRNTQYPGESRERTLLQETLPGETKPHAIEPPLRQSETDTFILVQLHRVEDHLYLIFRWRTREDVSEGVAPSGTIGRTQTHQTYIIRINPGLVGQPGFWGKHALLPDAVSSNCFFDKDFLYYTQPEKEQSFATALRDLFSYATVETGPKSVLYRVPLPQ